MEPVTATAAASTAATMGVGMSLFKTLAGLIFVLACIAGLAWLVRRLQNGTVRAGQITLLGGMNVGPRERVMLIEAAGKQILIGVASGQVQALHVYEEAANRQSEFCQVLDAAGVNP